MNCFFSGEFRSCSRFARGRFVLYTTLILIALGVFSVQALAQQSTMVGTVTDPTGAAVAGASVTITHVDTGQQFKLTTNDVGQYVAPPLRIGQYNIRVEAKGFKASEQKGLTLNVGDRSRADFKLEVGNASEQVTVEAAAVAVQSDTGEVSGLITGQQMTQLASNGRSIYSLVNLQPGATSLQNDFQVPTPVGGDANVSFNGGRPGHNLYMMDGGENLDRGGAGTFSVMPSVDAIAEFRVLSSNYSAEYGLTSAATMTTVLKSGTKQFHGSGWWFGRNDALDARNYFNTKPKPMAKLRFNTYGFNVGGPVQFSKKSEPKTFFFYNMEWRKLIQGGNLVQKVPFTSTYGGNFASHLPADVKLADGTIVENSGFHVPCQNQLSASQLTAFAAAGITQFSTPVGTRCSVDQKASAQPTFVRWPSSLIPTALLNANAQALLAAGIFPAPTDNDQFRGGSDSPTNVREEIVRMDHTFNSKFSIFGHFVAEQIMQTFGTTMWSGDNVPTIGNTFGNPSYSGVVHATHTINDHLLNEIAFNYNGNRIHILPQGLVSAPSGFTFNRVFTGPNDQDRIPIINLATTGTQYSANWTPWNNKADSYQIRDDMSWVKGRHQLKFGASWLYYKKVQDVFASTQGNFQFNGSYTGNDFADFLLGYSNNYNEAAVKDFGLWNSQSWAAYIQDNFRVNNRLTLNLGLRWDGIPHTYEANDRGANFYPELYDPNRRPIFNEDGTTISPSSPGLGTSSNPILSGYKFYLNGIGISGTTGAPSSVVKNHWNNWGPRLGFAYDLTGQGKTLIRGGFGIMFDRIQGNDMYNSGTNVPFSASASFNNVLLSNPKTGIGSGTTISPLELPIVIPDITGMNAGDYKNTTNYQYSLGVQHALAEKSVLTVSYVGSQTRHLSYFRNINLPAQSAIPSLMAANNAGNLDSFFQTVAPYAGFRSIQLAENGANGKYNSLQIDLRSQIKKDLTLQAGYTFSHAWDPANNNSNGYDLNAISNPYVGWRYDWGYSFFDRPHVAFVNYVWSMPFFRNSSNKAAKMILGGWEISGIASFSSGAPVNLTVGGTNVCSVIANCSNRPDQIAPIKYVKKVVSGGIQWIDPSSFAAPAAGTWGNAPHNAIRGPGRNNFNTALFKQFNFSERARFELRAETFNTFNHPQFRANGQAGGMSNNVAADDFGKITGVYDPRSIQLGAKFIF